MKTLVSTLAVAMMATAYGQNPREELLGIEWVTVRDAGNPAGAHGKGSVTYEYRIMKYELTNAQYVTFANTVWPDGGSGTTDVVRDG